VISEKLRKEFLTTIGETYATYGYPEYCGWIEGLLHLEKREWSQKDISERLGELFPESKYPTSVPSVSRALKIIEDYGVVSKTGSRKTGYRYSIVTTSNLFHSMVHNLMTINTEFIDKLEVIANKNRKNDADLKRATTIQIKMAKLWNKALLQILNSTSSDQGE
jgi:DNA-binding transcriptional regulator GbsR (MarR family)